MKWIGVCVAVGIALMLLACAGLHAPVEMLFYLGVGWVRFLGRVVPQLNVNVSNVVFVVLMIGAFAYGLHAFLAWFYQQLERRSELDWQPRWTNSIVALILLAFVAGISMVGVTHQIVWLVSDKEPFIGPQSTAMFRAMSANQLMQVGVAAFEFDETNQHLPAGALQDAHGQLLHGWLTQLLPYIDPQTAEKVRFDQAWHETPNREVFQTPNYYFGGDGARYGTAPADGFAPAVLAANVNLIGGTQPHGARIPDGAANTILAGEVVGQLPAWGHPLNWRDPARGLSGSAHQFGSPWSAGVQFVMADGSVRTISRDVDPGVLAALATPDGGEKIPDNSSADAD